MRRLLRVLPLAALFVVGPLSLAHADVISMEEDACSASKEGDTCKLDGKKGVCVKSTCTRNDYSQGVPPGTKEVECLLCEPGKKAEDVKTDTEPDAEQGVPASADSEAGSATSGGCMAVQPAPLASLGLGLLLLGLVRRRGV